MSNFQSTIQLAKNKLLRPNLFLSSHTHLIQKTLMVTWRDAACPGTTPLSSTLVHHRFPSTPSRPKREWPCFAGREDDLPAHLHVGPRSLAGKSLQSPNKTPRNFARKTAPSISTYGCIFLQETFARICPLEKRDEEIGRCAPIKT